jgi:catechol 2,3-dioxygenase-like lactoylglutathione lyase family enzyme
MERISRRALLATLPAALAAPRLFAQSPPPIPVRKLTYFALNVSDVGRSVDFYQGLFGMPIQARQGSTVLLRVGSGPQFLALAPASGAPPRIDRLGLSVQGFDADRVMQQLLAHGLTAGDGIDASVSPGPMKARIVTRGAARELYFGDPNGIVGHLHDTTYCGGGGRLGEACGAMEPSPKKGLLAVQNWSHFTAFVADGGRSNAFFESVFGLKVQARQGPTAPLFGVGDGIQFVMFGGGFGARGGGQPPQSSINHICLNMTGFDRDAILKTLEGYGIKPRGNTPGTPPLISYVSLRMPNRGGAPEGTPELYFTDPDGLLVQLQDVRYCGGSGYLGEVCG